MARIIRIKRFVVKHTKHDVEAEGIEGIVAIIDVPNSLCSDMQITYGPCGMVPTYAHAKDMSIKIMHDLKIYSKDQYFYELEAHGYVFGKLFLVRPTAQFRRYAYDKLKPENMYKPKKKKRAKGPKA